MKVSSHAMKVFCRFRPSTSKGSTPPPFNIDPADNFISYTDDGVGFVNHFSFDKVFPAGTQQQEIFNEISHSCDVLGATIQGFNCAILAYGQTSSGKTWTIEGIAEGPDRGLIPNIVDGLYHQLLQKHSLFTVSMSYYEIYCEKVRDLLNPQNCNMKVRQTKEGFIVEKAVEVNCETQEAIFRTINIGKLNRASAPTLMNADSSRSHSILLLVVTVKDPSTGKQTKGRLSIVDLAGSEKVSKTGASGLRLDEAKNINKSLTALGMVINALSEASQHVPYRDSILTKLLMSSLGGNSKTTIILCCAPETQHALETLSTLRLGERAKRAQIRGARPNFQGPSASELTAMLCEAQQKIALLEQQLSSAVDQSSEQDGPEGGGGGLSVDQVEVQLQQARQEIQNLERQLERQSKPVFDENEEGEKEYGFEDEVLWVDAKGNEEVPPLDGLTSPPGGGDGGDELIFPEAETEYASQYASQRMRVEELVQQNESLKEANLRLREEMEEMRRLIITTNEAPPPLPVQKEISSETPGERIPLSLSRAPRKGYFLKQGAWGFWKKRYFVLDFKSRELSYCLSCASETEAMFKIRVVSVSDESAMKRGWSGVSFSLRVHGLNGSFVLFGCDDEEEKNGWRADLETVKVADEGD